MILASKHTDNLPEAIIRTTSLGRPKGDNNPATNTFVSTTTFDAVEFSESRRFQRKEIGICFLGGRPQRPQEAPQEAFPCQNRRVRLRVRSCNATRLNQEEGKKREPRTIEKRLDHSRVEPTPFFARALGRNQHRQMVSRLGLEPRALALKGRTREVRLSVMESDGV